MENKQRKIAERPHQIVERVAEFLREGDLEGVVTMFHADCKIAMDPTQPPMEGHEAVRTIFADFVKNKVHLSGLVSGEMINGDTAILQGKWTMEDTSGKVLGGGASTEVVKQLDHGGWVYFIDCPMGVPEP